MTPDPRGMTLVAYHNDADEARRPHIGRPIIDLVGQRFGRLVVVELSHKNRQGNTIWTCCCDCGATTTVASYSLRQGSTVSCGCYRRENGGVAQLTHGMTGSAEYRAWSGMKHRCSNPANPAYKDYGGRGITVCGRWTRFEAFIEDMGLRPSDRHSLDRIDNDAGYCKKNCRWATHDVQMNNMRPNRAYSFGGRTMNLSQWASETGLRQGTLYARIHRHGWTVERALTTPSRSRAR